MGGGKGWELVGFTELAAGRVIICWLSITSRLSVWIGQTADPQPDFQIRLPICPYMKEKIPEFKMAAWPRYTEPRYDYSRYREPR